MLLLKIKERPEALKAPFLLPVIQGRLYLCLEEKKVGNKLPDVFPYSWLLWATPRLPPTLQGTESEEENSPGGEQGRSLTPSVHVL